MKEWQIKEHQKAIAAELIAKIKEASDLDDAIALLADIQKETDDVRPESSTFVKDMFAGYKCEKIFASDGEITLKPLSDSVKTDFLEVSQENSSFPHMFAQKDFVESLWAEHFKTTSFYCSIHIFGKNDFVGYCGLKDSEAMEWEIAIELLKRFQRQGFGYHALRLFFQKIKEVTGHGVFLSKVDPDNVASQKLMEKLGGIPYGIDTYLIKDEDCLRKIEEEHKGHIDERLIALARQFGVAPKSLLTHVLIYRFEI